MNANGVRDPGEPGLAGWTIQLHTPTGWVQPTTTDAAGNYVFDLNGASFPPGTYHISEVGQSGWVQSRAPSPVFVDFGVGNQPFTGNDFGNYQPASVSGRKFEDMNGNGADNLDPGVGGWPITLTGTDGMGNAVGPITQPTQPDGTFSFTNLKPGSYKLTEDSQPGWEQSYPQPAPPGEHNFTLVSGEHETGRDFGNYQLVTVMGRKYEDMNADGDDEAGNDPGLENWTIHLDGTNGLGNPVNRVAQTDMSGDYIITNLAPGNYTVTEEQQPGWNAKQGADGYPIQPLSGDTITDIDFGNWRYATVEAVKYDDLNGNGAQDAGEPPLPDWDITLEGTTGMGMPAGPTTQQTDGSGETTFVDVVPGDYVISETLKNDADWVQAEPSSSTYTRTIVSGEMVGPLPFGNLVRAEVHGQKFNDVDEDGVQDSGEPGLGGWQITLIGTDGMSQPVNRTTSTAPDGTYSFTEIMPGNYQVCETNPDPLVWYATLPTPPGSCHGFTLQSHGVEDDVDFGNYERATIEGRKFNDKNKNGLQEPDEPFLAGWEIRLTDCQGNLIPTAPSGQPTQPGETSDPNPQLTDATGLYQFRGLHNGEYCVDETLQQHWVQTVPCLNPVPACGYSTPGLLSGETLQFDFGNFKNGNIIKVPESCLATPVPNTNCDPAVPKANLWICETGPCDGPGEGSLRVIERAINVSTGDQNGDTVPDGLGAYEFDVEYDNLVIASLNPCDIVFGATGAGAARGPVDELNASAVNPDCADDAGAAGNGSCSFSLILENVIHFGCATSGQAPGPTGMDIDLASLLLIPHEDLADDLFPGNDNGVVTVIKDNGCELVDIFGHPVTGSVGGGLTPVCGNLWVTVRILEGDIDLDCDVDVSDQQKIAFRYGTFFGSSLYGTWYDLEPNLHDLDIDIKDLQKVFGRDGSTCQSPVPEQTPADPPVP